MRAPEEHADETQQVTKQLANASQGNPEVPDEVEGAVHAALIAETALTDNGQYVLTAPQRSNYSRGQGKTCGKYQAICARRTASKPRSQLLDLTVGAVKARLFRARLRLREELSKIFKRG